jgi:hypothetical protein
VGEAFDVRTASDAAVSGPGVFVFALSHCEACRSSRGALAQIVGAARQVGATTLVVTGREQPASHDEFAGDLGLPPSAVHRQDLNQLRLRAVPTVVVVDARGLVVYVHEGVVTEAAAAAAIAAVRQQ